MRSHATHAPVSGASQSKGTIVSPVRTMCLCFLPRAARARSCPRRCTPCAPACADAHPPALPLQVESRVFSAPPVIGGSGVAQLWSPHATMYANELDPVVQASMHNLYTLFKALGFPVAAPKDTPLVPMLHFGSVVLVLNSTTKLGRRDVRTLRLEGLEERQEIAGPNVLGRTLSDPQNLKNVEGEDLPAHQLMNLQSRLHAILRDRRAGTLRTGRWWGSVLVVACLLYLAVRLGYRGGGQPGPNEGASARLLAGEADRRQTPYGSAMI